MVDIITIKRIENKVSGISMSKRFDNSEEALEFCRANYPTAPDHTDYGFSSKVWGITTEDGIFPLDNSNNFFGDSPEGMIMIYPILNKEPMYLIYEDPDVDSERIELCY